MAPGYCPSGEEESGPGTALAFHDDSVLDPHRRRLHRDGLRNRLLALPGTHELVDRAGVDQGRRHVPAVPVPGQDSWAAVRARAETGVLRGDLPAGPVPDRDRGGDVTVGA